MFNIFALGLLYPVHDAHSLSHLTAQKTFCMFPFVLFLAMGRKRWRPVWETGSRRKEVNVL